MYGLNIHLLSFRLNKNIVQGNDKVRLSVTTMPEKNKDAIILDAKELTKAHHFFTVDITDKTEKIIFVLRKKTTFQGDPIIASTVVDSNQFPSMSTTNNTEVQTFKIYEPRSKEQDKFNMNQNRKVYGQMQIQFGITHPLLNLKANNKENGQIYSKKSKYSDIPMEKENINDFLFIDNYVPN
ncbi:hypothetical protein M9Y10_010662 [Tritrichomonas musculus]|uniref:Uncharacterized protein n=1 Tax=Tritrichomonas musculus TaxID=1915356 RepID=A0ABR2ILH7_9EUKA